MWESETRCSRPILADASHHVIITTETIGINACISAVLVHIHHQLCLRLFEIFIQCSVHLE